MKVILNYWNPNKDYKSVITGQKTISGETDIEIFETFYKENNTLRYCNGSFYTFVLPEWTDKYHQWLDSEDFKQKSFELYYGGGVVD